MTSQKVTLKIHNKNKICMTQNAMTSNTNIFIYNHLHLNSFVSQINGIQIMIGCGKSKSH